ncbi:MAG TPA: LacI family DNA-binding transcriptional regulator [Sphingobacterium sp.]|nr:LacI family DNA-binding transcriptional regulator [Sphingobacterium sp.]
MAKHQITIMDIARDLGISKSTVSRALKDHPDIKQETRHLVKEYAEKSGYRPNMMALNLKKNKNNIIGVIVPDIERPFYASLISGIQQQANRHNFFVLICQSKDSYITELNIVQTLLELRVSGIILCHSKETVQFPHFDDILKRNIPLLLIERPSDKHKVNLVGTDHFVGGYMIGEHLIKQGYKDIAIIGGPPTLSMSNQQKEGCINAVENAGYTIPKNRIKYCNFQRERVLSEAMGLLNSDNPPDAFFCVHDRAAIELLKLFGQKGIKVPEEVGVAGFGNEPMSSYIMPGLTTVAQDPFRQGELATEIILQEILSEIPMQVQEQIMHPRLIVRKSTLRKG